MYLFFSDTLFTFLWLSLYMSVTLLFASHVLLLFKRPAFLSLVQCSSWSLYYSMFCIATKKKIASIQRTSIFLDHVCNKSSWFHTLVGNWSLSDLLWGFSLNLSLIENPKLLVALSLIFMVSAVFSSSLVSGPTKEDLIKQPKKGVESIEVSALVLQSVSLEHAL